MDDEVLEFIKRRFSTDCNWISGNCYYFAEILKLRFTEAVIFYDIIYGHFFVNIHGQDYDWTGKIQRQPESYCIEWEHMKEYDELLYDGIIRDCII